MSPLVFLLVSLVYVVSLALLDAFFNRLIFREHRLLHYSALQKRKIYNLWEWKAIGVILIIVLPLVLPVIVAYSLGGYLYTILYLAILVLVQWDMIFGFLVLDDFLGDSPSIALPKVGWVRFSLKNTVAARVVVFFILVLVLLKS